MRHFVSTVDWTRSELQGILDSAHRLRSAPVSRALEGKTIALLFLNPSLRTRTSFETGIFQMGGHAVVLEPGKGAWGIEFKEGAVMDGEEEEHIAEVARVLSRYTDLIGLRAFPLFQDWEVDREDRVLSALTRYAEVPVVNMETIVHPCQELAFMRTIQDHLGAPDGRKLLVTWTWHPRPLNTAVANSGILMGTRFGMQVTLLIPDEAYHLDPYYLETAKRQAKESGGDFSVTTDLEEGYRDADWVYAKSWGALPLYGRPDEEARLREPFRHFIVDEEKMSLTRGAHFSHCLPLRRNVKATDGVMDSPACVAVDEAENRLHVQKALMLELMGGGS